MEMRRKWNSPVKGVEVFVPQEYCDACFTATGMLECTINDGKMHGYPCANTRFTIQYDNGVLSGTAQELNTDGTVKTTMDITDVNVPCGWANIDSWKGEGCSGVTWTNQDDSRPPVTYNHTGNLTINTYGWTWPGHPNHS